MNVRFLLFWDVRRRNILEERRSFLQRSGSLKEREIQVLFNSVFSRTCSSPFCFLFLGGFEIHLFVCSAMTWQFYPFLEL
jgi:hypothetical protein